MQHRKFLLEEPNFPTLQSIEAQSEYSVDLRPNEDESNLMRIMMLCIQLDRKDMIIEDLQNNANRGNELRQSQIQSHSHVLQLRSEKLEMENRGLIESNAVLRSKISSLQRKQADFQLYKSNAKFNQELENKARMLQVKLKNVEQALIESQQNEKQLKTQLSMLEYSNIVKASQKNKIRDLQIEVSSLKNKLQKQITQSTEQKHLIDRYSQEIRHLKEQQFKLIKGFQQKIELLKANQNLRQSQCIAANDQKVVMLTQELNRLRDEIEHYRNQNNEQNSLINERNQEIGKLNMDLNCYESQLEAFQKNFSEFQIEINNLREQQEHYQAQIKQLHQTENSVINHNKQLAQKIQKYQEINSRYSSQQAHKNSLITNLQAQLSKTQDELSLLKAQLRKLRRSSQISNSKQCQICNMKYKRQKQNSRDGKGSKNSIQGLDFQQLIKQTEKLRLSNSKIESLINYHQFSSQNSIDFKSNSRIARNNDHSQI